MKRKFSTDWKASRNVAKQRKYRYQAPLHTRQKFLSVHLSPALRKRHGLRSICVRKGDKVKVLRGQHRGRENKVERIDLKGQRVYVSGVEHSKKDGSKSLIPLRPSNIMITDLDLDDKMRKKRLGSKSQSKTADAGKAEGKQAVKGKDERPETSGSVS